MDKKTKGFKKHYWMDLARILGCIGVIAIHSQGNDLGSKILTAFLHSAVPVFVMISGTNFLNKDRDVSVKKMWQKYIFPLLIIFFSWSFIYAIWNSYVTLHTLNTEFVKNVIINTVNGHYHLWYIWMTVGIYAVTPFIKKITDNSSQKELFYYLVLAFSFLTLNFLVCFYPFDNFASLSLDLRITLVSGFLIFYIGGCFLSRLEYNKKTTVILVLFGLLSLIGDIMFAVFKLEYEVNSYFTPFTIGLSFSLYWIFSRFCEKFCEKHCRALAFISRMTLPIYMSHIFGIEIIKKLFRLSDYGVIWVIPISIAAFILCFGISYLLSLTKITKKLFVGK